MIVLSAWLGLALERVSLSESLAVASILCTCRVTLRLGVEQQRHFVRGRKLLLVRSSDSEDGAIGDSSRETVAVALSW